MNTRPNDWFHLTPKQRIHAVKAGLKKGRSIGELADELKVTAPTLYALVRREGLQTATVRWLEARRAEVEAMLEQGSGLSSIARELKVSLAVVVADRRFLVKAGRASAQQKQNLAEKHTADIERLQKEGLSVLETARRLGIFEGGVYAVRRELVNQGRLKPLPRAAARVEATARMAQVEALAKQGLCFVEIVKRVNAPWDVVAMD